MTAAPSPPVPAHLACTVAGRSYALPLAEVQEILRLPGLQPGPGAGLLNLRGRAVPVLDLGRCLGFPDRPADPGDVLVVLRDGAAALWVEGVEDIIEPDPLSAPESLPASPFAPNLGAVGARVVGLLDLDRLVRALAADALPTSPGAGPDPAVQDLLAARARACLPPPARPGDRRPVLSFTLGGEPFALDLRRVREIAPCPPLHPLPGAPPAYPGLAAHRGGPLLVLDPRPLLGLAPPDGRTPEGRTPPDWTPDARLLVVDEPGGRLGLYAEAVGEVVDLDGAGPVRPGGRQDPPEWLEGEWEVAGRPLLLVRLEPLLAQPVPFP